VRTWSTRPWRSSTCAVAPGRRYWPSYASATGCSLRPVGRGCRSAISWLSPGPAKRFGAPSSFWRAPATSRPDRLPWQEVVDHRQGDEAGGRGDQGGQGGELGVEAEAVGDDKHDQLGWHGSFQNGGCRERLVNAECACSGPHHQRREGELDHQARQQEAELSAAI